MSTLDYLNLDHLQIKMMSLQKKPFSHILFILQNFIVDLGLRKYKCLIYLSYHQITLMNNQETCNSQQNNVFLIRLLILYLNL